MTKRLVPAHHVPFALFAQVARLKKLENHGRQWEVFFSGRSLGFADGTEVDALAQAHRGEVNNALYLNQPEILASGLDYMPRSMPSAAALADYPDLAKQYAEVIATQPLSAWTDALSMADFHAYIRASYQEISNRIRNLVIVPDGHAWQDNPSDALRWFQDGAVLSTESGTSFFINRTPYDEKDEKQFMVEVRYFWQGRNVVDGNEVSFYGHEKHRVTLWCEQGLPFFGTHRSLLANLTPFFYHDTIESLAIAVAQTIEQAITAETRAMAEKIAA